MKKILVIPLFALTSLASCQNNTTTHTLSFASLGVLIEEEGKSFITKELEANREYTFLIKIDDDFIDFVSKPTNLFVKTRTGEDYQQYTFSAASGELTISLNQDVTITTNSTIIKDPALEESSWSLINKLVQLNLATEFYKIGDTKTVLINDLPHQVRIIGFNHDKLANSNAKTGITFEFMNPIEAIVSGNYKPYVAFWAYRDDNTRFLDQQLNMFLNHDRNSVLSILPTDLQAVIKNVDKEIATGSELSVTTYQARLFPLSYAETTVVSSEAAPIEGTTYQYYIDHADDSDRAKILINGETFDSYWLRSPAKDNSSVAWSVDCETNIGQLRHDSAYDKVDGEKAIVPAFCI